MKIHIMGASCAGSTTLGRALGQHLNIPLFDTDEYFWVPSEVPYTIKRNRDERIRLLKDAYARSVNCIVTGSLVSWGDEWKEMFDLVIFLYVPPNIRLERLKTREIERYGEMIETNEERALQYKDFIEWASRYEDPAFTGRSLHIHQEWLKGVKAEVLEIRGDTTVNERLQLILNCETVKRR